MQELLNSCLSRSGTHTLDLAATYISEMQLYYKCSLLATREQGLLGLCRTLPLLSSMNPESSDTYCCTSISSIHTSRHQPMDLEFPFDQIILCQTMTWKLDTCASCDLEDPDDLQSIPATVSQSLLDRP